MKSCNKASADIESRFIFKFRIRGFLKFSDEREKQLFSFKLQRRYSFVVSNKFVSNHLESNSSRNERRVKVYRVIYNKLVRSPKRKIMVNFMEFVILATKKSTRFSFVRILKTLSIHTKRVSIFNIAS